MVQYIKGEKCSAEWCRTRLEVVSQNVFRRSRSCEKFVIVAVEEGA